MFLKKKHKEINLIDFSIQEVSTGQIDDMLKYLAKTKSRGFSHIKVEFRNNQYGDTRCYLTIEHSEGAVIQWFKDRNSAQVEEFAKSFSIKAVNE